MCQLTVSRPGGTVAGLSARVVVPRVIADAGEHATRRFLEFFAATIRNKNTPDGLLPGRLRFFRLVRSE